MISLTAGHYATKMVMKKEICFLSELTTQLLVQLGRTESPFGVRLSQEGSHFFSWYMEWRSTVSL